MILKGNTLKKLLLTTVLTVTIPLSAHADSIYSHDENGNSISGSATNLVSAVESGRQIVVGYTSGNIRWMRTCEHTSVQNQVVSCYVTNVFDTKDGGGSRTFDDPAAVEAHIFNTTGYNAGLKQNFFTGAELSISPKPATKGT